MELLEAIIFSYGCGYRLNPDVVCKGARVHDGGAIYIYIYMETEGHNRRDNTGRRKDRSARLGGRMMRMHCTGSIPTRLSWSRSDLGEIENEVLHPACSQQHEKQQIKGKKIL
jgi:hypothetical protein